MHQKQVLDLFNFCKFSVTVIDARNYFENKIFWKGIIKKKPLKKLTLFSLLNLVSFDGQDYEKQKEPGASDQSLFRL